MNFFFLFSALFFLLLFASLFCVGREWPRRRWRAARRGTRPARWPPGERRLNAPWTALRRLDKYQKKRSKYPVDDWPKRYKPVRPLGKGHDGMCYLCHDTEVGELVAVKVLNPKRNRKITEPLLMRGLAHRHIVRLRDHFLVRSFNFLVLDYCEKGDLCALRWFMCVFFAPPPLLLTGRVSLSTTRISFLYPLSPFSAAASPPQATMFMITSF